MRKFFEPVMRSRMLALFALIVGLILIPSASFAGEGNIRLQFSESDKIVLYISLVFGAVALFFGFLLRSQILKQSSGPASMQSVGKAIYDGAMAYLQTQMRTMSVFVVIIAIVLFVLYMPTYGPVIATLMAVCFILGVAASYIAGYVGMNMAVQANTRTAFAALKSYKLSLEIAFRSGAVAGLITVGMGLLGATLIFLFAGQDATKLLVGFGFGGSLAALFMRVGGGIYTKAADVGADLVGKVEAGIPEDDPRNPAVIADNVGDNVGDCAGMAADVFESYEVTLVAAIVLGAATAAIFDTQTWMRLVLFALMARGLGIIASIIGIYMVKGEESIEADPLHAISKGFKVSAAVALLLTVALGYVTMGGMNSPILTNQLISDSESKAKDAAVVIKAKSAIASKRADKNPEMVTEADVLADPTVKALSFQKTNAESDDQMRKQFVSSVLSVNANEAAKFDKLEGYSLVSGTDKDNPVLKYAVNDVADPAAQTPPTGYITLAERLKKDPILVYKLLVKTQQPDATGKPNGPETANVFYAGPAWRSDLEKQIDQVKGQPGIKIEKTAEVKVNLYSNGEGELVMGVDPGMTKDKDGDEIVPYRLSQFPSVVTYKFTKEELEKIEKERTAELDELNKKRTDLMAKQAEAEKAKKTDEVAKIQKEIAALAPTGQNPTPTAPKIAVVKHTVADWWKFVLCIGFGIIMAFAFERLTDFYVSLNRKPVQEVGNVATAGPAPMIISGFALGMESSFMSVIAIIGCLIAPLMIFPANEYGGYLLSFYGIALVGLGLLTTTGFILAMDTFGPISDNAQGVFEMSGEGHNNPEGARRVQLLDAAGNTTKALTKGFAIATAVVAAVALFHAFVEEGKLSTVGMRLEIPEIFLGVLLGCAAPFLFSAFSINAVGRAAFQLIEEVRRQFRADAGIMAGTSKPDYGRCVAIVTAAAQKELLGPGILAIGFPLLVAFGFSIGKEATLVNGTAYNLVGVQALGGFLVGTICSGQLLAVMLANSGGIWDNAKKLIEDGLHGGKGTDAHKAAVVCDTVGDPFKDTAGPALNPLIKVMNLVALLIAPQVILPLGDGVYIAVTVVAAAALAFAVYQSKKGSMSDGMKQLAETSKE